MALEIRAAYDQVAVQWHKSDSWPQMPGHGQVIYILKRTGVSKHELEGKEDQYLISSEASYSQLWSSGGVAEWGILQSICANEKDGGRPNVKHFQADRNLSC
jgi:hypothetical protein